MNWWFLIKKITLWKPKQIFQILENNLISAFFQYLFQVLHPVSQHKIKSRLNSPTLRPKQICGMFFPRANCLSRMKKNLRQKKMLFVENFRKFYFFMQKSSLKKAFEGFFSMQILLQLDTNKELLWCWKMNEWVQACKGAAESKRTMLWESTRMESEKIMKL